LILGFDFEGSVFPHAMSYDPIAFPVCLCVISDTGIQKEWVFNHDQLATPRPHQEMIQEIQEIVDQSTLLVGHNVKFDLGWLHKLGIDYSKQDVYCTQVAEYLINGQNNRIRYSLAETSKRYGIPDKIDKTTMWWASGYETNQIPLNTLIPYCYQDVANTLAIYFKQQPIIKEKNLSKLTDLSCELSRVLEEIEWHGMLIDKLVCQDYSEKYGEQIIKLKEELLKITIEVIPELKELPINFGSSEQISAILFGGDFKYKGRVAGKKEGTTKNGTVFLSIAGLGFLPRDGTETKTAGVFSTDKAQFDGLQGKTTEQKRFLEAITELSNLEKMKGTYYDGMLKHEMQGLVHCNIHQTRTVTGRFSATDPALQTVPRSSTSPIKAVFISRYKGEE